MPMVGRVSENSPVRLWRYHQTLCEPLSCHSPLWTDVDVKLACPRKSIGNYSVQMLANCFCMQEIEDYREDNGWTAWFTVWFSQSALCEDFVKEWGLAQALPLFAPLCVVLINAILKVVLTRTLCLCVGMPMLRFNVAHYYHRPGTV